jgi:hypothetical protein
MKWSPRVRLAAALWVVLAGIVWNVIFDRVMVLAGRRYVYDAAASARLAGRYVPIDGAMPQAVTYGVRLASGVSIAIAALGLAAVIFAARRDGTRRP